jgi:hypothetical protein
MAMFGFGNTNITDGGLSPLSPEHRARQKQYARLWDYYRGRHRKNLVVKPGQADDNVTLNYSRRVVDKGLSFLFGQSVEFELDAQDERNEQEVYLDGCWGTSEQKRRTLMDWGLNGAITGTGYLRLYEALPGEFPRIAAIDPATMEIITGTDDIDDIRAFIMAWKAGEIWKRHRIDLQANGTWVITEEESQKANAWRVVNETLWPYQGAPVHYAQNLPNPNEVYGISDLEEADINDAINWTASNINRILRFHAHPKTIGTGFDAAKLQNTAIDQFWTVSESDAKVFNLEMQSDLASAYSMLQALKETYSKVTGVPDLDPDKVNVGALSGFALRILYGDLLDKTMTKRVTYGATLSDVNATLLEMADQQIDTPVNTLWKDPLPESVQESITALAQDRANGLSLETYLERRGYDAEREMQRIADEKGRASTLGEELLKSFEMAPL